MVGVPDERWGERPKAFVVLRPGGAAGADELLAHVRGLLAGYKCPDRLAFVDELPQDLDRQGAEARPARAGVGRAGVAHQLSARRRLHPCPTC